MTTAQYSAKQILTAILVVWMIVLLCTGGWFAYWMLAKKSVSNQYDINTNTQQYQAGLISEERDRVAAYDLATDDAQKANIRSAFCAMYADLTKPPADLVTAQARICS